MAEGGKYIIQDGIAVLVERTGHNPEPPKTEEVTRENTEEVHPSED